MILLIIILAFLAFILIRALAFRPKAVAKEEYVEESFNKERVVSNLQALVRCKTVSYHDKSLEDEEEFRKLIKLLPELYPEVYRVCTVQDFPDRALLFHWRGKGAKAPAVLMAHYDVVPVAEEQWQKPPFEGIVEDGVLWGRGSLDTKVTFNGVLSAANHLIEQGFIPESDIYFAFSGGEEINGDGAIHIVDWFEAHGIEPAMVVDEGGAVVEGVFPGVSAPCGLIGIAEKGLLNVEYQIASSGGHASAPPTHTPVGELAMACSLVEAKPFPSHITKPVAEMLDTLGRHSSFLYKLIFANLWCFKGILDGICKKSGGELNALMRTTVAFTQMNGSSAPNVIPPKASMVSNIRLNPEDSIDSAMAYLRGVIANDRIELLKLDAMEPSRISSTDCDGWKRVCRAVSGTWKGCIVSPYLMVQCSDSRHYGRISDKVYRFSAMDLTKEERASIHGNNERIRLETAHRAAEFYIRLIKQC